MKLISVVLTCLNIDQDTPTGTTCSFYSLVTAADASENGSLLLYKTDLRVKRRFPIPVHIITVLVSAMSLVSGECFETGIAPEQAISTTPAAPYPFLCPDHPIHLSIFSQNGLDSPIFTTV